MSKNTKIVIGIFIGFTLLGSCFVMILQKHIKESEAFAFAMEEIKKNEGIKTKVGEVVGVGFFGSNYKVSSYSKGDVIEKGDFQIPIQGSKNDIKVSIIVYQNRSDKTWSVEKLVFR